VVGAEAGARRGEEFGVEFPIAEIAEGETVEQPGPAPRKSKAAAVRAIRRIVILGEMPLEMGG
jgi:hypothetical protein